MDDLRDLKGRLDAQRAALSLLAAQLQFLGLVNRAQWEADTMSLLDTLPDNRAALDEMTKFFELTSIFMDENHLRAEAQRGGS